MRLTRLWLLFVLIAAVAGPAVAGAGKLHDARLWSADGRTRVVFDLSRDTHPDIFMLAHPDRLVIDLPHTRNLGRVARQSADSALVSSVRAGIRHGTDVRVVIDLSQPVKAKSFMLDPDGAHGYRLVVDLFGANTPATGAGQRIVQTAPASQRGGSQAAARRKSATPDTAADHAAPADEQQTAASTAAALAATQVGTDEPTAAARQASSAAAGGAPVKARDIIVAIDPGHGGKDSGARGPGGLMEKNITLAIARRLQGMVNEQPHMQAVLTRHGDYYVPLRKRMVIARRDKADFFISIHCDASPHGGGATGASVYALSPHGATSEHARWLARRENAADLVGGASLRGKNSSLASFVLDLSQSASIDASLDAGRRVLAQLDMLGDLHKTTVQQAGFMVLKSPDIPSILVETNFISNPHIASRLASAGYQRSLARAMLMGIKGYFARYRPATEITANEVYRVKSGDTLSEIAQRFDTSEAAIRHNNDLSGNGLRAGQRLIIANPAPQQLASRD